MNYLKALAERIRIVIYHVPSVSHAHIWNIIAVWPADLHKASVAFYRCAVLMGSLSDISYFKPSETCHIGHLKSGRVCGRRVTEHRVSRL